MHSVSVTRSRAPAWKCPFTLRELAGVLRAMLDGAGLSPPGRAFSVELLLVDDRRMEDLHRQSLGCDGPTNILSFPASGRGQKKTAFLGSLALSVDTMARECFLYHQDSREHCLRLLAHGLAHLLGHDHGPDMHALCARLEKAAAPLNPSRNGRTA